MLMEPLEIGGWTVEKMATSHFHGRSKDDIRSLRKFIRVFLAKFHSEGEVKATLVTTAKIQAFHAFVEGLFEEKFGKGHEDDAGAWTLAFLTFWYRNRGSVDKEEGRIPNEGNFYTTMHNEWEAQRKKGHNTDSILQYTITHPKLGKNPYFTIPMRIEHVRRIRVYWNKEPKILNDCRSHLNICQAELKLLDKDRGETCSSIPGRRDWLEIQVKLQEQLCDLREASRINKIKIDTDFTDESLRTNEHERKFADVMQLWKYVNERRIAEYNIDAERSRDLRDNIDDFIHDVKKRDPYLAKYLNRVWGKEDSYRDKRYDEIEEGDREPIAEDYLQIYFKQMINAFNPKSSILADGKVLVKDPVDGKAGLVDPLNHSLRNSIFRVDNKSTYPIKTPDLGKKVSSAPKIMFKDEDESVEDKSKSSLINDCRDSVKLAIFLLEKIQLRSGRNMNKHVSLVLWDLMFRFWTFLGVPTFTKTAEHRKKTSVSKYISDNDKIIAEELQYLINGVFTRARFVVASQYPKEQEDKGKLIPIIDHWREHIGNKIGNNLYSDWTNLGEIQARCGNLIGKNDEKYDKIRWNYEDLDCTRENLILFQPNKSGDMWEKGLEYTNTTPGEGQISISEPPAGERADES